MGARRRHQVDREPEAGSERRAVVQREAERDGSAGGPVLELQRAAGNRAVAERMAVAREPATALDAETKKGSTLTLEGFGSFELASWSWGAPRSSGGYSGTGGGSEKQKIESIRAAARMSQLGDLAARLSEAAARGTRIDEADLVSGSLTIHLTEVMISSYQVGGGGRDDDPMIQFTLQFADVSQQFQDEDKKGATGP